MRYHVTLGGRTFEIDLGPDGPLVDGRRVDAELAAVAGTPVRHLRLDGRSLLVHAVPGSAPGEWRLRLNGDTFSVEVLDERRRAIQAMTAGASRVRGPSPIRAPMPGLVVRVDVEPGQSVQPGQGLVIVEAMKMENELRAEAAGVVARVLATAGQAVEKGTVLVEFQAEAAAEETPESSPPAGHGPGHHAGLGGGATDGE